MSYTAIAALAFLVAITIDRILAKYPMTSRKSFWTSYAIILPFQLLTNWWLTSRNIVMYTEDSIIGIRICAAPVEDLFFGFALIISVLNLWAYWNRKGSHHS